MAVELNLGVFFLLVVLYWEGSECIRRSYSDEFVAIQALPYY